MASFLFALSFDLIFAVYCMIIDIDIDIDTDIVLYIYMHIIYHIYIYVCVCVCVCVCNWFFCVLKFVLLLFIVEVTEGMASSPLCLVAS